MEFSLEELDRYAVQKRREQRNEYNKRNPGSVMQNRVTSSTLLLFRLGLISSQQKDAVLTAWEGKRKELYPAKGGHLQ